MYCNYQFDKIRDKVCICTEAQGKVFCILRDALTPDEIMSGETIRYTRQENQQEAGAPLSAGVRKGRKPRSKAWTNQVKSG